MSQQKPNKSKKSKYWTELLSKIKCCLFESKLRSTIIIGGGIFVSLSMRYVFNKLHRRLNKYPPGPEGLFPFFGYSLNTIFTNNWHIKTAINYGPIVYFKSFHGSTILLNNSAIVHKLLSRKELLNRRPMQNKFQLVSSKNNEASFASLNGSEWHAGRQLMSTKLIRILNTKFVNQIYRESINKDLIPYLNDIISNKNGLWYSREILEYLMFNTVFQANFGKSLNLKQNKLFQEFKTNLQLLSTTKIAIQYILCLFFPFLPNLFGEKFYIVAIRNRLCDIIKHLINIKINPDTDINDDDKSFINYTLELNENNVISEGRKIADILLMFGVATDTTSSSLEYGIILIAQNIDIQIKIRNELKKLIKNNNICDTSNILYDINLLLQLPLFRSFIHEVLRIACVTKLGSTHYISNDIYIDEYDYILPSGSTVFSNIDYINNYTGNHDDEKWKYMNGKGKEICLENWLNDSKNKFIQNESFLSFGYGGRDCVGKQLALKQLRIVFGYLLLNYKFSLQNPNQEIIDKGGVGAITAKIKPQIPVIIEKIV